MSTPDSDPTTMDAEQLRDAVRDRYAAAARQATRTLDGASPCCGSTTTAGSAVGAVVVVDDLYGEEAERTSSAALAASLGCGNPTALAELHEGETVLDLGSGGGLDVLLSARRVGPTGKAYGLDMTPEMLDLARRNQAEAGITNAEFLQGTIEDIPLPDNSVDVIISNCVINLAADKDPVLREAYRVLKPGGRFAISDIVLLKPLPEPARRAMRLWTGCISGALLDTEYLTKLTAAGFTDATIEITHRYGRSDVDDITDVLDPGSIPADLDLATVTGQLEGATASAFVRATKPA